MKSRSTDSIGKRISAGKNIPPELRRIADKFNCLGSSIVANKINDEESTESEIQEKVNKWLDSLGLKPDDVDQDVLMGAESWIAALIMAGSPDAVKHVDSLLAERLHADARIKADYRISEVDGESKAPDSEVDVLSESRKETQSSEEQGASKEVKETQSTEEEQGEPEEVKETQSGEEQGVFKEIKEACGFMSRYLFSTQFKKLEATFYGKKDGNFARCNISVMKVPLEDALTSGVLEAIANTSNVAVLSTDFVYAVVLCHWESKRWLHALFIGLQVLALGAQATACHDYVMGRAPDSYSIGMLCFVPAFRMLRELSELSQGLLKAIAVLERWLQGGYQIHGNSEKFCDRLFFHTVTLFAIIGFLLFLPLLLLTSVVIYLADSANWFEWASIALQIFSLTQFMYVENLQSEAIPQIGATLSDEQTGATLSKIGVALFCAMQWLSLLYSLRPLHAVGRRLMPLIAAIFDTAVFILMVIVCLLAATNAHYVFGTQMDKPSPFWSSLSKVFQLGILSSYELYELEGVEETLTATASAPLTMEFEDPEHSINYVSVQLFFYMLSVAMSLILMNLFIGVLGQNYEIYENLSKPLFVRERAKVLLEYRNVQSFLGHVGRLLLLFIFESFQLVATLMCCCCLSVLSRGGEELQAVLNRCSACLRYYLYDPKARTEELQNKRIVLCRRDQPAITEERSMRLVLHRRLDTLEEKMGSVLTSVSAIEKKLCQTSEVRDGQRTTSEARDPQGTSSADEDGEVHEM